MAERATLCPPRCFPGSPTSGISAARHRRPCPNAYGIAARPGAGAHRRSASASARSGARRWASSEGSPVLVLDRVVMTRDGRPAEWRVAECNLTEAALVGDVERWQEARTRKGRGQRLPTSGRPEGCRTPVVRSVWTRSRWNTRPSIARWHARSAAGASRNAGQNVSRVWVCVSRAAEVTASRIDDTLEIEVLIVL